MKRLQLKSRMGYLFKWLGHTNLTFLLILAFQINVNAAPPQQNTVSGTVSDETGPLPGVSILIKGTNSGTTTDPMGNFKIQVDDEAILVFSFIGYVSLEQPVDGRSVIDVIMEEDMQNLDEVVVLGYTTRKRGELTGSVSTVESKDIASSSSTNIAKSLSGRVPGLIVADRGGYPGTNDITFLVRGQSTLNNNSPLIVLDGVPTNSFAYLAPSDIESITVLKDASAAIYGARAANGVILVTTKRGSSGKPTINFNTTNKFATFTRVPSMMNSYQYTTYQNEIDERYGNPIKYSPEEIQKYQAGNDPINYPSTDWYDLTMADHSFETRNSLTISGGTDAVKYFVSGNALNQGGMYESGDLRFKQYQIRSNLDVKVNDFIKLGVDLSGINGKRTEPGVDVGFIHKHLQVTLPTEVGQYPNGLFGVAAENGANPRVMASSLSGFNEFSNSELRSRFTVDLDLSKITDGLSLRGVGTFTQNNNDSKLFNDTWTVYDYNATLDEYIPINGFNFNTGNYLSLTESHHKLNEEYYNVQLGYEKTLGAHSIKGFVAYEQITGRQKEFEAYKRDLISKEHPSLFAGGADGQTSDGVSSEWGRLNFFGSIAYDYKKKYLVDFTLRRDGSSNFAEGKQFGTFPGVSAGWVISEESFLQGAGNWLDFLKIRASWAQMGNDRVPPFQYLTQYNYGGGNAANRNYYIFGESPIQYNSFFNSNVPNPNITWERADSKNIGISFSFLDDKISGDVNYFYQKRTDILVTRNASVPDYTALQLPQENIGKVDNFGYELELYHKNTVGNLSYVIGGNFTMAKNKIVYMDEAENIPEYRKQEGHPMSSYLIYPSDGLFKSQEEIDNTPAKLDGTLPGDVKYIDQNGDGRITGEDVVRKYTSPIPELQYGISGSLQYKGFEFNILFQGQGRAEIEILHDNEGNRPEFQFTERWTETNIDARYPRAFQLEDIYNAKLSNVWLHNAAFVRLKDMEIAYTIPSSTLGFANIRVFARGSNLITFDHLKHLKGFDPEMSRYRNFTDGIYGPLKSITFGANIQF
ncbi:SusC/RagA family TonB-linked outer membrane protein [Flexithrix dorotheae]|uniref:SusC/RagA family TonB-linked outer membrane protein n=1 Tax=Flexithrix dorotheae TaxID=70993 RepID=UPI0012FAD848|nr:TonB-dependent receptor [Flexithrix dorotheae]